MADRKHYSGTSEELRRRQRQRQQARPKRRKRVWLRVTVIVLLLAFVAAIALGVGAIVAVSRTLPSLDDLERKPNALNTTIYDRHGNKIAELHGDQNRVQVGSGKIPDIMKQATVAVEDERFYSHHGVDFQGITRAMIKNIQAGRVVEGGSTITQQLVKNAYRRDERTYSRKLREAALAWQLEDRWSKDKILTEYLNTIYYGDGAYGVEAAARTFFHKTAAKLTVDQAALLAALPKFPSDYSPTINPTEAKIQRNKVLHLMADQGYITQDQADRYSKRKLGVYQHPPTLNNSLADYFTDYVTRILTKHYGSRMVFEGGLKVYTSIDMDWQAKAIDLVKDQTESLYFGFKPSMAFVAVDPANGYIRTMVGGLDYKEQKYNLASQAKRQPGSSMKSFVLTTAVLQGMNPYTTYYSSKSPMILSIPGSAPWVVNGDGSGGPESVSLATTISDNVVYAQLAIDVGPSNIARVSHKMGITSDLREVPSIALGSSEVTPMEMATAYATLASGGIYHKPQAIVKVVLPNGDVDWKPKTKGSRVIPAGVASVVTDVLTGPPGPGGTASSVGAYFPYARAGKTGTSEDNADAWYCGYTPQLAAAVWMGDMDERTSMGSSTFGGTYCAPVWAKFFAYATKDGPHPSFKSVPWSFTPWDGAYSKISPSASASPSESASPSPTATKTITPKPTKTPTPKPTATKTPTPTPTPTATQTPKPTQSAAAMGQDGFLKLVTESSTLGADESLTGDGSTGVVGALTSWLARTLNL